MKMKIAFIALLGIGLQAAAQDKSGGNIVFTGTADTMYNGSMVVLYNKSTNDFDSAVVKDGHFAITVPYKEPSRYMFYSRYEAKKKGGYAPYGVLVTKPGEIKMQANMETFTATTVTGAPENDLYIAYAAQVSEDQKKMMDQLSEKYGKEFLSKPDPNDPRYKAVVADYQQLATANQPAATARLEAFIKKNPGSFVALYALASAGNSVTPEKAEELYGILTPEYKKTSYAEHLVTHIEAGKITAIGKTAPLFEQPDTAGNVVKLADFRGKYVLVDFWASWCGPCRAENPNVVKAFAQYKDKGFTILGVSLDQPGKKDAWIAAIHKDNLTWTQVSDLKFWDNAVAKLYGIQAIPQNYLLDPQGKIIATNIRGEELNKKLAELFKM